MAKAKAVTVLNLITSQWSVRYSDGSIEPVANSASASCLAQRANNIHEGLKDSDYKARLQAISDTQLNFLQLHQAQIQEAF